MWNTESEVEDFEGLSTKSSIDTKWETGDQHKRVDDIFSEARKKLALGNKSEVDNYIFTNFDIIENEWGNDIIIKELWEIFRKIRFEKKFQKDFENYKEKFGQNLTTYNPSEEDRRYIQEQTGWDPVRTELYAQASFVMRAKPEELERSWIKPDEAQRLRIAAESLGFKNSFTAETFVQSKTLAGFSEEKTAQAQEIARSTIPAEKLKSTTITREGTTLTYEDGRNPKYSYQIDLWETPPKLSKVSNWLKIDIQRIEENPERKVKQGEVVKIENSRKALAGDISNEFRIATSQVFNIDTLSTDELNLLLKSPEIENIAKELNWNTVWVNGIKNKIVELERKKLQWWTNMSIIDWYAIEYALRFYRSRDAVNSAGSISETLSAEEVAAKWSIQQLLWIKNWWKIEEFLVQRWKEERARKELWEIKAPSVNEQNENVNFNLNYLIELGYHELGQDNLKYLIDAMNNNTRYKWKVTPISMESSMKFDDGQMRTLHEVVDKILIKFKSKWTTDAPTNYNSLWQWINQWVKKDEWFRNMWKNRDQLNAWLDKQMQEATFDTKSSTP